MDKNNISIVYVNTNDLHPAEYNPRKWSEKQKDDLRRSINENGLIDPIIVNSAETRFNVVIGGHFRLAIAKELGYEKVPVVYVSLEDINAEKKLNLRLNKNTGEFDIDKLSQIDMDTLLDVGFTEFDIALFEDTTVSEVQNLPELSPINNKDKYNWLWIDFSNKETMERVQEFFDIKNREIPEEQFMQWFNQITQCNQN